MKEVKIKTKKDVDGISVALICGLVFFVLSVLVFKNILLALICAAALLFFRLRSGKLIIKPGDVYFAFGKPGSGKTLFQAAVASWNKKKGKYIFVNEELSHLIIKDEVIQRSDIGTYRFGSSSRSGVVLYDEVSLDGFDNRNFKNNFKGSNGELILKGLKKCRHRYTGYLFTNQGYNEVDAKIREGLVKACYWLKNKGWYSVAIRLDKDVKIDEITGQPMDVYLKPSWIDRILDPSKYIYINHKKYGKLYSTVNDNSTFYLDRQIDEISDDEMNELLSNLEKDPKN